MSQCWDQHFRSILGESSAHGSFHVRYKRRSWRKRNSVRQRCYQLEASTVHVSSGFKGEGDEFVTKSRNGCSVMTGFLSCFCCCCTSDCCDISWAGRLDDDDISGDVDAVLNREDTVGARCGVVGVRVNFWFKCSSDTIPIGDVCDGEFHVIVAHREVDLVDS